VDDMTDARDPRRRISARWRLVAPFVLLGLTASAGAGSAQPPADPAPAAADPSFELGALVDTYYGYHFNTPDGDAPLRNFDTRHNQFALSMAEVWLASAPTADRRVGFNVKLTFGPASSLINAFEPGTTQNLQNLEQAYVSYLAPAGKGLQVDVGKFVTPLGAEVIEAKDNWNYSRSLLFALAIPYYHMGARVSYSPNDRVSLAGYVVNGWNDVVENNSGKTVGAQLTYKPFPSLSVVANYMAGPEQSEDTDWRRIFDTTVTYTATSRLSLMANYDYGQDAVAGAGVHWTGVAAYARYQATDWLAFVPRAEWYDDSQGFTTGVAQTLKEITVTAECKAADNFLIRTEYRNDVSNVPFFTTGGGAAVSHQGSFTVAALYAFSVKR
jgi:hypothetical protein